MRRNDLNLAFILLAGLLIAWSMFIPIFEGPDESGHYCHAEYIARNRRLPNFNIRDGCYLAYPPGYYVLLAPVIALNADAHFSDEQIQQNQKYISNRKDKNVFSKYLHSRSELFLQWNPLLRTVHILRLVSIVLGLGIIFLTIKAAKLVTKYRYLPFSSIVLFFNPMFLHTFSLITNVTLVSFLATVFIYLHLKQETDGSSGRLAFFGGFVLGLGAITKINMLSLVMGYVFTLLSSKWKPKEKLSHFIITGLGFFCSAGWYIWRTIMLYGEPFEVNIASSLRGGSMMRMQDMGLINYWSSFPDTLFRTFWSGYGLNKIWFTSILVVMLLITILFSFFGFFSSYRRFPRLAKVSWFYVASILLGHVFINMKTEAFHAKDIFTAYLPLSLIISFGAKNVVSLIKKERGKTTKWIFPIFGISLLFYGKFEIVRLVKAAFQLIALFTNTFTREEVNGVLILLRLLLKGLAILTIIFSVKIALKSINLNCKTYKTVIIILVLLNALVLFYSSFKLYAASL